MMAENTPKMMNKLKDLRGSTNSKKKINLKKIMSQYMIFKPVKAIFTVNMTQHGESN